MTKKYPESPCIGVCKMDDNNRFCLGCARALSEIVSWSKLSDKEKAEIYEKLEERKSSIAIS
ncbi:MAG: DUF1289 domain-containing protein [Calditrichaeota bacterium]|nr:DUF1289 domain-containing protein [Calditrichota bacterium]RQV93564.1 MAG: DUF1289 domain-containing protein [bacterium]RQW08520.1 MAG: DUF1289 domain-containing protein [Calditrichota bacterium]